MHSYLALGSLMIAAAATADDGNQQEVSKLAGTWTCTAATNDGKPLPEETVKSLKLTLTEAGGYKTELAGQVLFDSTFKIDPGKQPRQIDMIATEGENKGKAGLGIYRLEGDVLTLCYTMPGKDRPKDFQSTAGSAAILAVWSRIKP